MQFINIIYTKSTNISFNNFLVEKCYFNHKSFETISYFQSMTTFGIMLGKDDISLG